MSLLDTVLATLQSPVALLYGGDSPEREVSLSSGQAVARALNSLGVPHVAIDARDDWFRVLTSQSIQHAIIMLHGGAGENGEVQALLKRHGISFTGSDVAACKLAMDKHASKALWREQHVPTAPSVTLTASDSLTGVLANLGRAVVVKPVHEGSSVGMSLAASQAELATAVETALAFDPSVLIEPRMSGPEFTVAIVNGVCLPPIMLEPDGEFYDYHAKYVSNNTAYHCPAPVSDEQLSALQNLAQRAFDTLGCSGWGRVDLMLDGDTLNVLEVNTVPGMTDHSLVPKAAATAGISFEQLVLTILAASIGVDEVSV